MAALLSERGVPFVAATGYGSGDLSPAFAGAPVLHKPFQQRALEQALLAAVKGGPAAVNGRR